MYRSLKSALLLVMLVVSASLAIAQSKNEGQEAISLVRKVAAAIKSSGREQTFRDINANTGGYQDRDMYVFVYDMNGLNLATGNNAARMVGKNMIDLKDADGKFIMREMLDVAKTKGHGWIDYHWVNPITKQIEKKTSYIERFDDIFIGSGIYKQ